MGFFKKQKSEILSSSEKRLCDEFYPLDCFEIDFAKKMVLYLFLIRDKIAEYTLSGTMSNEQGFQTIAFYKSSLYRLGVQSLTIQNLCYCFFAQHYERNHFGQIGTTTCINRIRECEHGFLNCYFASDPERAAVNMMNRYYDKMKETESKDPATRVKLEREQFFIMAGKCLRALDDTMFQKNV